jgi:hypothetical protein
MSNDNEMSVDVQNNIQITFNLYKNDKNKINKLKLRTMLFSFVMYKNSATDINQYIEEQYGPDKEEFDFDEVCDLVNSKLKASKVNEADEIFTYITGKSDSNYLKKSDLKKAFATYNIEVSPKELDEMMKYITAPKKKDNNEVEEEEEEEEEEKEEEKINKASKSQFKAFYCDKK